MLEKSDCEILRRPFAPEDHEFFNGYAYVAELAVCMRLEEVDPSYEFRLSSNPEPRTFVAEFVQVWQKATMTIKGVTRENTGMAKVESTKKGDREAGEPEKSSATDSLRRCARLFGVGQYLLNCPGWVQDTETMREWLNNGMQQTRGKWSQSSQNSPQKRETAPNKPNTHNGAVNGQNGANHDIPADKSTDHVLLRSLTIVDKDGQKRLKFKSDDGRTVLAFTRQLFKERGWIDEQDWTGLGDYPIKDGIPVGVTFHRINDDGGYWEVTSVSEVVF